MTGTTQKRKIIGESAPMQAVLRQVAQVAPTKATVLITGETGVGKDVIAEAIHDRSQRKDQVYRAVNCGEFLKELVPNELFGHEKEAFTGATSRRPGIFKQTDGGTLFLDEVGEMSPEAQVKFLRVLETQEVTTLGGGKTEKVDVRIIAATNIDLATSVREKKFRQDLYYRLNLFRIHIPPLRDRREDIPLFVTEFIEEFRAKYEKPTITHPTQEAGNYLQNAAWYGNVRELRNAVETAVILSTTEELQLTDLPKPEEKPLVEIESDSIDTKELYKYRPEVEIRMRALIQLFERFPEYVEASPASKKGMDRVIYTLSALIEIDKLVITDLAKNVPSYEADGGTPIKLMTLGGLKRRYEKLIKPILERSQDKENLKSHFNQTVVDQLNDLTTKYIPRGTVDTAIAAENAHKSPTHRTHRCP